MGPGNEDSSASDADTESSRDREHNTRHDWREKSKLQYASTKTKLGKIVLLQNNIILKCITKLTSPFENQKLRCNAYYD